MKQTLLVVALGVFAVAFCGAMVAKSMAVAVVEEAPAAPAVEPAKAAPAEGAAPAAQPERPARETRAAATAATRKNLAAAQEALAAATKALEEGKKDEAMAQIKKATEAIAAVQKSMERAPAKKAVNAKCPITGNAVDPKIETREFKGQLVGFCCAACPPAWDKLSDDEKDAKLKAATAEGAK